MKKEWKNLELKVLDVNKTFGRGGNGHGNHGNGNGNGHNSHGNGNGNGHHKWDS
ncbi:paeninodin family lasso peptide [Bacillus sp. JJ722]|uniref:paeninodin family lasso peptide n=1 Tax=Bacillus sp. JJ722 TaxID=3122973 RepID=UPI002FFF21D3